MFNLYIAILLLATSTLAQAAPEVRHSWRLIWPAAEHPEQYAGRATGHFGRTFVGAPIPMFHPVPDVPSRLRNKPEDGVVHAALLIDKNGRVRDVAILGKIPDDIVDKQVLGFFRKVVFAERREGKKTTEFETEMVLVFKPVPAK